MVTFRAMWRFTKAQNTIFVHDIALDISMELPDYNTGNPSCDCIRGHGMDLMMTIEPDEIQVINWMRSLIGHQTILVSHYH